MSGENILLAKLGKLFSTASDNVIAATTAQPLQVGDHVFLRINHPYCRDVGVLVEELACTFEHAPTGSCCTNKWLVKVDRFKEPLVIAQSDMYYASLWDRFLSAVAGM